MRRFSVTVYGDNAHDMEVKAYTLAREVFGPRIGLQIHPSYGIFDNKYLSSNEEAKQFKYHASMEVYPLEPLTGNEWYPDKHKTPADAKYTEYFAALTDLSF